MSCKCQRVYSDKFSPDQCRECWLMTYVKSYQRSQGVKEPAGKYESLADAAKVLGLDRFPGANFHTYHLPAPFETRIPLKCINEREIIKECHACGNKESAHERRCTIHGTCTRRTIWEVAIPGSKATPKKTAACDRCNDYQWDLFPGYADPLSRNIQINDVDAHREALKKILSNPPPYHGGEGTGIIYVGGGKYWEMIALGCRLARRHGWKDRIQVWFRGTCERVEPKQVSGLDVEFIDADAMARERNNSRLPQGNADHGGWEAKPYAIAHTTLRQILHLDADAMMVGDATPMMAWLKESPFNWWQDLENTRGNVKWPTVWPDWNPNSQPIQGGQFILDRQGCWPLIAAVHWMNQHSNFYYQHGFGDQDTWRVAIAAGACPTNINRGRAPFCNRGFVFNDLAGKPFLVHYTNRKMYGLEQVEAMPFDKEILRGFYKLMAESLE